MGGTRITSCNENFGGIELEGEWDGMGRRRKGREEGGEGEGKKERGGEGRRRGEGREGGGVGFGQALNVANTATVTAMITLRDREETTSQ